MLLEGQAYRKCTGNQAGLLAREGFPGGWGSEDPAFQGFLEEEGCVQNPSW